jgi:ribosomal protein S25
MTEILDRARREVDDRLAELRDEVKRLEAAAAALGNRTARRRGPQATKSRATSARRRGASTSGARRGRRRGSGQRATQAEQLVREHPGITVSDLAKRMKIKPNYLYRVLPELQKDGKVRKRGKEWHPA